MLLLPCVYQGVYVCSSQAVGCCCCHVCIRECMYVVRKLWDVAVAMCVSGSVSM